MLRLYNTLTRKIEEFKPINPPNVGYYSCGPTVYDFAHIGHARTFIFADILQRVLTFNGYKVKRVMNITDVGHLTSDSDTGEDKMELASRRSGKGSRREKKTVWEIAKFYTDDFFKMIYKLNITRPEIICKATDYIGLMISMIKVLEKKGFTYKVSDGIYFDTSKLADYGKLTGNTFKTLQKKLKAGARVEHIAGKKNITDFALWKFSGAALRRQMEWESPWGRGFPGWHIECSAMSMKFLGDSFDIHTGGVDHIPIHHTNEIAQSEAATGKKFVNWWLHGEHLLVEGKKMSKSLGNFIRVDEIEMKGFHPLDLRYLFLTTHYRQQMNFTWKSLEAAGRARRIIQSQIPEMQNKRKVRVTLSAEKMEKVENLRNRYFEAVNNNLNIPQALAILWETLKSNIPTGDKYDLILLYDEIFGLRLNSTVNTAEIAISAEVKQLIKQREKLRSEKKFNEADIIREEIEKRGFFLEDTTDGTKINRL